MSNSELTRRVLKSLEGKSTKDLKVVMGFDGFVDEIIYLVDKRYDPDKYDRIEYMADYARKVDDAKGLSMNIELVPIQKKLGGNGPILANSLIKLGTDLTYLGAMGKEVIEPVFHEISDNAHVISFSDPGHTDAIEFLDGKIISSKLSSLNEVTWENLEKACPADKLAELIDKCDLFGMENWTLLNNATQLWRGILENVIPLLKTEKRKHLFIDLADPEKRTDSDIMEALEVVKEFDRYFEVTLGLNLKESKEIAQLCGMENITDDASKIASYLYEELKISRVVIHPVKEACAADASGVYRTEGFYCSNPKLTTGAGDNFNAGFLLGQILGLDVEEALLLGTANSGYYVRNARSASFEQIKNFLKDTLQGEI